MTSMEPIEKKVVAEETPMQGKSVGKNSKHFSSSEFHYHRFYFVEKGQDDAAEADVKAGRLKRFSTLSAYKKHLSKS